MSRLWLIAERQFKQEVMKKSFLLALVSLPLFMAFMVGMGALGARLEGSASLGFVDDTHLIQTLPPATGSQPVQLIRFENREAAQAALDAKEIEAFYVLPAGNTTIQQAELVFAKPPSGEAQRAFERAVRLNLLAGHDPQVVERVLAGPEIVVQAQDMHREFAVGGPTVNSFLPVIVAFILGGLVLTVSTTLMEALVVEKENRVIEVMVTSVSAGQMMAGKILGILAMGLLLLVAWLGIFVAAFWLGGSVLNVSWMQGIQPNWRDLGLLLLVTMSSMVFASALMVIIGATLVDGEETQQVGALVALAYLLPIYLLLLFANNPNSLVALAFSLFPMTSVTSLAIRSIFVEIPVWQFLAAAGVALVGGIALIWLAGKALRVNMLRYGQRLRLGQLVRRQGAVR